MENAQKLPIGQNAMLHGVSKTTIYNFCTTQGAIGVGVTDMEKVGMYTFSLPMRMHVRSVYLTSEQPRNAPL